MRIIAVLFNLFFIPGAGQIAMGRWRRGLPWLVAFAAVPLAALVAPWTLPVVFVVTKVGSALEVAFLAPRDPLRGVTALAVYGGTLVAAAVWFGLLRSFVIEAFKIPAGGMIPTLEIGDHLFINKLSYRFGEPARGDLAVFESPCQPDTDYVKRIVALAGDTVEVRCDVLYVNGKPAPSSGLKEECAYWDRGEDDGQWEKVACARYVETLGDRQYELVFPPVRREQDRLRKVAAGEKSYAELLGDRDFPDLGRLPGCSGQAAAGRIEESPGAPGQPCAPRSHYVVPDGTVFVLGDNRDNSADSRAWGPVPLDHLKGKVVNIWWSSKPEPQGGIAWDRIGPVD